MTDDKQKGAGMRSWRPTDRAVVSLRASDLAGRRVPEALPRPGRSNPDGPVRTVSGGLPTLGKRQR
ncbi:hypothetical protein SAMN04489832_2641 [Micromonospora cremea]|uniref:Uncharacterized protein n=1 Tax=Micromonospora cremea TaxID=709881 RepID=A0A1N5WPD0_9ACTN|nr:hypothetical protein SAMN04489832_2641 [Micromonospora cremea]